MAKQGLWPWLLFPGAAGLYAMLRKIKLRPYLAIGLAVFALGLLWTQVWLYPSAPDEGRYAITGKVYGEAVKRTDNRMTFYLSDVRLNERPTGGQAYCSLYAYGADPLPELFDGAQVAFTGRVYHPQGKGGPHDFDYAMWLLRDRISFGVSAVQDLHILNTPETAQWNDVASRIRDHMSQALTRVMGTESRLAMALLFNQREGISEDEQQAFQRLGIAHVMSVSGLHVGILGGLLIWLLGKLRVPKKWRLPILAVLLVGYCGLTGFSAAAVRAAVMLMTAMLGRALGRRPDPLVSLATALVVVLMLGPLQLFFPGLVLSFSAMAGILLLQPVIHRVLMGKSHVQIAMGQPARQAKERLEPWRRRVGPRLAELFSFSLAAQLGVLLPTAVYFHQIPLYGVVLNMAIVPLMGVLVPLYFITLACSPIPWLGMAVGWIAQACSAGLLWMVKMLATLPYAAIRVSSVTGFVLYGVALTQVLLSRYFRRSWPKRLAALALVVCLTVGGTYLSRPEDLRYIQLSVGQADAALIMDGNTTVAVDVGEHGTEVAGYLLAEGRDLDALFLTHLHLDHGGGIAALLEAGIQVRQVYLPLGATRQRVDPEALMLLAVLAERNIPVTELAAGDEVRYNKVGVEVLWPWKGKVRSGQDANDLPLVLSIDFDGYTLLSASDLTGRYEGYAAVPCNVLKVAHHGSADSTGDAFLDLATPSIALVTCELGSQRLPTPDTLARLAEHGVLVYRTDERGDITLTVTDGKLELATYQ